MKIHLNFFLSLFHLSTFEHLPANWGICKMQKSGLLWSFLPPGTASIWHSEAQSRPLSLFSFHVDGYCLIMDPAGSLRLCVIINCAQAL